MLRIMLNGSIATLALLTALGIALPLRAQTERLLTLEQDEAFEAGAAKPGSLSVAVGLDRADATYAAGDAVQLTVQASEDAFVTVLNIGASGRVTQLFPNAFEPENRIRAGEKVDIPSAASGAAIRVTGKVGAELIKVIATSKLLTLIPQSQLLQSGAGPFRSLEGGTAALKRDLEVVSTTAPAVSKIAIVNQVIKTVPTR